MSKFLDSIFDLSIPRRDRVMVVYKKIEDFYRFSAYHELGEIFRELCQEKYLNQCTKEGNLAATLSILTATNNSFKVPMRKEFFDLLEHRLEEKVGKKKAKSHLTGLK